MKITIDRNGDGVHAEIEREPLPKSRFKAVCVIMAAGIYAGMVAVVTALCGVLGLLLTMGGTVLVGMVAAGFR